MPKALSSRKKKHSKSTRLGREPTAPTTQEWERMKMYNKFAVDDRRGKTVQFSSGQTALVQPQSGFPKELHDYWVAQIKEIKCREDNPSDVWVKVNWYYSSRDASTLSLPGFDPKSFSKYERILSNHEDCVHSETFERIVKLVHYDERALDAPFISNETFFTRYTLDIQGNGTSTLKPKLLSNNCICDKGYTTSSRTQQMMHFCPRPSCRKWFHQDCLVENQHTRTTSDRQLELTLVSPDSDESFTLGTLSDTPSAKRSNQYGRRRRSSGSKSKEITPDMLEDFPDDLVSLAGQPIVKCAVSFPAGGVTGNVGEVVKARRLVYELLQDGELLDDWATELDFERGMVNTGKKNLPPVVCPDCQAAI